MYPLPQVLFLIDTKCFQTFHKQLRDDLYILRLACLRLLLHFAHNSKSRNSLKWGYKFYDSSNLRRHSTQRKDFREFNVEEFELFEKVLANHNEQESQLLATSSAVDCALPKLWSPRGKKSPRRPAANSFNRMLKDTLLDFQWDQPDISSPVRMRKKSRKRLCVRESAEESENVRHNFVFVVTACPQSDDELLAFSGFESLNLYENGQIFGGLLSDRVFSNFLQMQRIHLCCLDSHPSPLEQNNRSRSSSSEIEPAAIYIPIHSLSLSHVPFTTIFSWYFQPADDRGCLVQNVMLVHKDQHMREKVYCNLQLISYNYVNSDPHSENKLPEKLCIRGLTKNPCTFETSVSFAVFPTDDGHNFLYLIQMLKINKHNLIVTWDNKLGLLQPLSSVAASLLITEVTADGKADLENVCLSLDNGSFEVDADELRPLIDAAWQKEFETYGKQFDVIDEPSNKSLPICHSYVLEDWYVSKPFESKDCDDKYQSMIAEENEILQRLQTCYLASEAAEDEPNEVENLQNSRKESTKPEELSDEHDEVLQTDIKNTIFSSTEDLLEALMTYYNDAVESEGPLVTCAENIVNTLKKNLFKDGVQVEKLVSVLEQKLFSSLQNINEKHRDDSEKAVTCREYELQALLRLNVINLLPDEAVCEKLAFQVVEFLRMLFYLKPPYVTQLLNVTVLERYPDISQTTLRYIYDDLMLPFPNEANSNDDDEVKSNDVTARTLLNSSPQPDSLPSVGEQMQSTDAQARHIPHCASFGGIGYKRQISIPKFRKHKTEHQKQRRTKLRSNSESSLGNVAASKGVCQNLLRKFGGHTSPNKYLHKKKCVLKTKTVRETPLKKQVLEPAVRRQIRYRGKSLSFNSSLVVEDTPEKSLRDGVDASLVANKERPAKPVIPFSLDAAEAPATPLHHEESTDSTLNTATDACNDVKLDNHQPLPSPEPVELHQRICKLKRRHESWPQLKKYPDKEPRTPLKRSCSESIICLQRPLSALKVRDLMSEILSSEKVPSTPLKQGELSPSPTALEVPYDQEMNSSERVSVSPEMTNSDGYCSNVCQDVLSGSDSNSSFVFSDSSVPSPEIKMISRPQHAFNLAEVSNDRRSSNNETNSCSVSQRLNRSPSPENLTLQNSSTVEARTAVHSDTNSCTISCSLTRSPSPENLTIQNSNTVEARTAVRSDSCRNLNLQLTNNDVIKKVDPFSIDISATKTDPIPKQAMNNSSAITPCFSEAAENIQQISSTSSISKISDSHSNLNHSMQHASPTTLSSPSSASLLHLASSPSLYINAPKKSSSGHWKKRKL